MVHRNFVLIIVLSLTVGIQLASSKTFTLNIDAPAPGLSELRALVAQRSILGCFVTGGAEEGDKALIGWNNGTGEYEKVDCFITVQWNEISYENTGGHSPLLIDLKRNGFQTGSGAEVVLFDIRDSGEPLQLQWVAKGTDDGFLSLDLNQNGIIDTGAELFGQGTDLFIGKNAGAKAVHGYQALEQYDHPSVGGNLDSIIDKQDSIWPKLRVWVDKDANGYSSSSELSTMEDAGIKMIYLKYKNSNRRDSAGNAMPYWSWVRTNEQKGPKRVRMVDIFFKEAK